MPTGGFDIKKLLQLLQPTTPTSPSGSFQLPRLLLGGGLLTAGALTDREPGEILEARQAVRNLLTPESQTGQFTGYVNRLNEQFQPLLTQQRQRGIEDISQRFAAAFPKTVGAQGPEFGALSRYITEEALPREQAFLGQLGLQGLQTQLGAGRTLLETARPDPLSQLSTILGYDILTRGQGGQGGLFGAGQPTSLGGPGGVSSQIISQLMPRIQEAVGSANTSGNLAPLAQLLSTGVLAGTPFPIALQASTPAGQLIQQAINAGLVESPAATLVSPGGGFLASGAGTALGALGAGAGGYFLGRQLGGRLGGATDSQGLGALGGAASGAAAGAAIGSVVPGIGTAIGAIIGGVAGAFGGFGETREQQHAQKVAFRQSDLDSQKDQVFEIGNIGAQFLSEIPGLPQSVMDAFASRITTLAEQSAGPGDEQGMAAQELGRLLTQYGQGLDRASLRQRFISYMMTNTFTSGNSRYGGGAPENYISGVGGGVASPWVTQAGLARGGMTRQLVHVVGERGPEFLVSRPGSAIVIPMLSGRN